MATPPSPINRSRIVIEGVDEPAKIKPTLSDRIKYDPWNKQYPYRAGAPAPVKRA